MIHSYVYITQAGITSKTQVYQAIAITTVTLANRITLFIVKPIADMAMPSVNTVSASVWHSPDQA